MPQRLLVAWLRQGMSWRHNDSWHHASQTARWLLAPHRQTHNSTASQTARWLLHRITRRHDDSLAPNWPDGTMALVAQLLRRNSSCETRWRRSNVPSPKWWSFWPITGWQHWLAPSNSTTPDGTTPGSTSSTRTDELLFDPQVVVLTSQMLIQQIIHLYNITADSGTTTPQSPSGGTQPNWYHGWVHPGSMTQPDAGTGSVTDDAGTGFHQHGRVSEGPTGGGTLTSPQ